MYGLLRVLALVGFVASLLVNLACLLGLPVPPRPCSFTWAFSP